jgi:hypothetical protein
MPVERPFRAVAFPENVVLKDVVALHPGARLIAHKEMHVVELVLDVARDRRRLGIELAVMVLIVLSLVRH